MQPLLEQDVSQRVKEINWKKLIIKSSLKIILSGIIKAIITHIVLSHFARK